MSFRSSTWQTAGSNSRDDVTPVRAPSTTALDFCITFSSSGLQVWTSAGLNLRTYRPRRAGQGSFALVEIGETPEKQPIVVKRSLKLDNPQLTHQSDDFTRHFDQLCLELRILTHRSLRKHENIVDILGICADDRSGEPSLSLVLEYASYGTLDKFLTSTPVMGHDESLKCASQVSNGLAALHNLNICHGDVKTRNVLVFLVQSEWVYKVSDFGHSIVSCVIGVEDQVKIPYGTPLYNAPEIRQSGFNPLSGFTISDALLTDVFSFGLLGWEILNRGRSFYDKSWSDERDQDLELHDILDKLVRLPRNRLLHHGIGFIERQQLPRSVKDRFALVLQGSLQDHPRDRSTMEHLSRLLRMDDSFNTAAQSKHQKITKEPLQSWTEEHTSREKTYLMRLRQILDVYLHSGLYHVIEREPLRTVVQEKVFSELRALSASPNTSQAIRAHAAMTIFECILENFGTTLTTGSDVTHHEHILSWLRQSALHGSYKAGRWFPRIYDTFTESCSMGDQENLSAQIEKGLVGLPSELYLSSRIRQYGWCTELKFKSPSGKSWHSKLLGSIPCGSICDSSGLGSTQKLLFAALTGSNSDISKLVHLQDPHLDAVSTYEFNPVHLACIGGHLSTLEILLNAGFKASKPACYGITAMHLLVFFVESDITMAMALLLKNGADANVYTTCHVSLVDHDVELFGTPLDWAIRTRNRKLVKALIPITLHSSGARVCVAIQNSFWEILDDILENSDQEKLGMRKWNPFTTSVRPCRHLIAHGRDRFTSIDRTLEVYQKHNLPVVVETHEGSTTLMTLIGTARTEEDFYLIQQLINRMTSAQIKKRNNEGGSALIVGLIRAGSNPLWTQTLEALARHYTIIELETEALHQGSYLHIAVTADSIVGARVLLRMGVNPNQRSIEMVKVLIEYGADMALPERRVMSTPLVRLVRSSRPGNRKLLDHILEIDFPESVYSELLQQSAYLLTGFRNEHGQVEETFRYLLKHSKVSKYVNTVDTDGITTLQRCAYAVSPRAVELLLEAGAGVAIGIPCKTGLLYPLQIACVIGRVNFLYADEDTDSRDDAAKEEEAKTAMRIGVQLLERHHAKEDGLFLGITPLHIASYVGLNSIVQQLQAEAGAHKIKGRWPSLKGDSTPDRLVQEAFKADLDLVRPLGSKLGKKSVTSAR